MEKGAKYGAVIKQSSSPSIYIADIHIQFVGRFPDIYLTLEAVKTAIKNSYSIGSTNSRDTAHEGMTLLSDVSNRYSNG